MSLPRRVLRLWIRPAPGAPMEPRASLVAEAGEGLAGDHARGGMRHVTLLFEDDWNAAAAAVGRTVDPAGRRANVLLSGGGAGELVGATVRLGGARIEVRGVTAPCPVMDEAAPGMQAALRSGARSGVWGRVVGGGEVRVGDELTVEPGAAAPAPGAGR